MATLNERVLANLRQQVAELEDGQRELARRLGRSRVCALTAERAIADEDAESDDAGADADVDDCGGSSSDSSDYEEPNIPRSRAHLEEWDPHVLLERIVTARNGGGADCHEIAEGGDVTEGNQRYRGYDVTGPAFCPVKVAGAAKKTKVKAKAEAVACSALFGAGFSDSDDPLEPGASSADNDAEKVVVFRSGDASLKVVPQLLGQWTADVASAKTEQPPAAAVGSTGDVAGSWAAAVIPPPPPSSDAPPPPSDAPPPPSDAPPPPSDE